MKTCYFIMYLLFSTNTLAIEKFKFQFKILGSDNQEINQVSLKSSESEHILIATNAGFESVHHKSPVYQFTFEAAGYYPSIQTFSHAELFGTSGRTQIKIPDIKLVEKKDHRVLFAFGGDVMMGRRYSKPYFNEPVLISDDKGKETKNILKHVKPYMEIADFAAVNLESQVSENTPSERAPKSVTFFSPPEAIDALQWAGVDYVTLGNNHIYDYVDEGLKSTLQYLKDKKMPFSGAGLNQQQALEPYRWQHQNNTYDMLGFVAWPGGFTPNQVATEDKGGAALGNLNNIIETVGRSVKNHHATIVQYHGSLEYSDEPTGVTEARLKAAIDHGADLVVAHHPHVTQGFELYNNKLIAYSLGNFVFDQYFYATPHSYILYVWLDGEDFHRAEIIPIYLKGYVPTPATGQHRNYTIKRTEHLSARRKLNMTLTGGHLAIDNSANTQTSKPSKRTVKYHVKPDHKTTSLVRFPSSGTISNITINGSTDVNDSYRLGVNQVNGGDFESYRLFDSDERGWSLSNINFEDQENNSLHARLEAGEHAWIKMKNFRRVFKASSQMTFNASINTTQEIQAELYFQRRKTKDKFFDAINGPMELLGQQTLGGSNQTISFDFDLPRVGYRSYRVMLKLKALNQQAVDVNVDELELIQWHGYYQNSGTLVLDPEILATATHLQLKQAAEEAKEITISYQR